MNKSELTPLWKAANNNLLSISSTVTASLLKRVMKDRKLSFSLCSMVSRLDEEFMPLSSNEIVDKQFTQFFEGTHRIRRYLAEPYLCWSFEGSREGLAHNLIRNSLKMHCGLESSNMIERVMRSIIRVQGMHLELRR